MASFVGQEARVRFFTLEEGPEAGARERAAISADRRLRGEILRLRGQIETLYADTSSEATRDERRAALEREARARVADLDLAGRDAHDLAERLRLEDACLALTGTYHADTRAYAAVLAGLAGDLPRFIERVLEAAESDAPRAALLGSGPDPSGGSARTSNAPP